VTEAEAGFLSNIARCSLSQRISIYADDVAMFLKPHVQDLVAVKEILSIFGEASGLQVNYNKSSAVMIQGAVEDGMVKHVLNCDLGEFPCRYLGLQLSMILANPRLCDSFSPSLAVWLASTFRKTDS
jgi:hypothetical protein